MRHNIVVSRYAIPIGILQVDGWSTGPLGFGASQKKNKIKYILTGMKLIRESSRQ